MPRIAVDLTPLRESRDLRLLVLGNLVSGLGTQAALVALPYQLYLETGSAFLTGLLGAVELVPLVTMALLGGAIADRTDRRRLLLLDQVAPVLFSSAPPPAPCCPPGSPSSSARRRPPRWPPPAPRRSRSSTSSAACSPASAPSRA